MAYTPTTWTTGDTITASAMNKIEQGIADGGGGAVIITDDGTSLDKTYAEIYDLINSGTPCYISFTDNRSVSDLDTDYDYYVLLMSVVKVLKYDQYYRILAVSSDITDSGTVRYIGSPCTYAYQASSSDEYPTFLRKAYVNPTSLNVQSYR